ncbi:hypothetical protein IV203_036340 [Nitzschia inconspicua]|uniref:Uncharacterized protein n=1 Tax=Nitzschia inconspicua TaxID=303405 RepID=A0A9K3PVP0_9STRA|nr:hypothetical protein IV203_036340 [Nitzschia inconspicua]
MKISNKIEQTISNNMVFKLFRKFGSCIPTRKSKGLETGDVVQQESKPVEEDDAAKDTEEEEADDVEEEERSRKPDAEEGGSSDPAAAASKDAEDGPKDAPVEERDGDAEPTDADPEEATREDGEEKPEEEKPAQDGDEYQWEISCCGVDLPLTK